MILQVLDRAASAKVEIIYSQHLRNLITLSVLAELANFVTVFFLGNCLCMRPRCPFQLLITYTGRPTSEALLQSKNKFSICASLCTYINMHKRRTDSHPFWEIRLFDELHLPIRVVGHPDI